MYFNIFAPIFASIFFIKPLFETLIVPEFLLEDTWKLIRISLVVAAICMRMMTIREEMQFFFNESYYLV